MTSTTEGIAFAWQPDVKSAGQVNGRTPADDGTGSAKPAVTLPNLPDKFWDARARLRIIRQAARYAQAGPDIVLLAMLCRLSAMRSHELNFDLGRGKGSLNLFGSAVGGTGLGKTLANNAAQDLLLVPDYLAGKDGKTADPSKLKDGIGVGTGEGMIEAFMGLAEEETGEVHTKATKHANVGDPVMEKVRTQVRHNAYFFLDEGESLAKLMQRQGATLGPTIRSAWMGTALGQQLADGERTRFIGRFTYSMGMVIGFQPETAQALLADGAAGTPQRYLWMSGYDLELPDDDFDPVEPFWLPLTEDGKARRGLITGPEWLRNEMRADRRHLLRGEKVVEQLDSHETLMRCKVAALLAVVDERVKVDDEDWELAGIVWETSCAIRDKLTEMGKREARRQVEEKSRQAADTALLSHKKIVDHDANIERVARLIAGYVADGPLKLTEVRRKAAYRDKKDGWYEPALTFAVNRGWIVVDDVKVQTGASPVERAR